MAKSGFEKFARGLGKLTGRLLEKAHEAGLDEKAAKAAEKAGDTWKRMVEEAREGASEAEQQEEEGKAENEAPQEASPEDDGDGGVSDPKEQTSP